MKRPLIALALLALIAVAAKAKADTLNFSFVSTPNTNGTYVDAYGTLTGTLTYSNSADPTNLNVFVVGTGTINVVSNLPASPNGSPGYPLTPALNGSSSKSWSDGGFKFTNTPEGTAVSNMSTDSCNVCFLMAGNAADGGDFTFVIDATGLNGVAGNSFIDAGQDGSGPYNYSTGGTLTLTGEAGVYNLTPEPATWLLLGSGVTLLGFVVYRRTAAA